VDFFAEISTLVHNENIRHLFGCDSLMRISLFFFAIGLGLAGFACGSKGGSDGSTPTVRSQFSSIQQEIFNASCNAPSCHGSGVKGGLSLIEANSYQQLTGTVSTLDKKNLPPFLRVKPGSPDSSFIIVKLTAPDTSQGEIMPKGSDRLSQDKIDAIRQWILDGAPNN
jgi:hypothetical protein